MITQKLMVKPGFPNQATSFGWGGVGLVGLRGWGVADLVEPLLPNSSRVAVLECHTAVVRSHQNDSTGSTGRHFSQVCSAVGGALSGLPPYPVALEGCLDISIHVTLVTLCHDHHSPADKPAPLDQNIREASG